MSKPTISPQQFQDSLSRVLDATLAKKDLKNVEILKKITEADISKWDNGSVWRGSGTPPTGTDHTIAIDYAKGLLYFKNELGGWTVISSGGGSTNNAEFKVTNTSGWLSKTVTYGASCKMSFSWSSIEDDLSTGNGTIAIAVDGTVKRFYEEQQGDIEVDVSNYLLLGANQVEITISDLYGNSKTYKFTVTTIKVSVSSYFDATQAYTGDIGFSYIPVGAAEKTVHFLMDGNPILDENGKPITQVVTASNREQPFTIPAQSHGNHTFEVYFTCEIDGEPVESNRLVYDLICYEEGNAEPIISSAFSTKSVKQYATVPIEWIAYTPQLLTTEVTITDNFGFSTTRTVDRTVQLLSYKAENVGATVLTFSVDSVPKKTIPFSVVENKIDVNAETASLELYLNAKGRSNQDTTQSPSEWKYGNIKADLQNFNFVSDGWQLDDNGDTVLRVSGNSRVKIPLNIFATDFRTSGKTIEFEFATRDVLNPNATVISCWSGNRGLKITAQEALLKSELSEISRQYKENEHIRITFTVQKKAENRLLSLYINGIESACVQYGEDDDFSQSSPVGISIGSNLCTTDVYCIRVYANNLTRYQVLDNWIADTQDIEELITRANRNDVFDDYGNVDITKLPQTLPYFVVDAEKYSDLPQYKGDKKTISGKYVDPLHPERSFTFYGAEIDVQGTSSQFYSRKNYKIKFKNGFTINGVSRYTYQLRENSMPTDVFTFKADVASSEGANNVELVMLYDEICPVKTPPQETDSRVRQGIEGYPCLMFYYDGSNYNFLGKYNFNNDKATAEVFGFSEGDESWEILTNETQMAVFKDDDFESTYYDTVKKKELPLWMQTFEARYPEDNTDTENLQRFVSWLKSTDTTAVNTEAEKQARLETFRSELATYANVNALIFNYIFTETFLMVDNRAKNAFPTRFDEDGKFLILPYDYDTAIGINNEGELKFGYWLEDTDLINGTKVYNGQDSVLYVNLRLAFADEIMLMYQELRKLKAFSYEEVEKRFREHQQSWGEAIFNEDAKFKYIDPLVNDGDNTYLEMLQGSKESQRQWWLYNRFRYLDSKYVAGDSLEDYIMLRPYAVSDITITPYADIYASIKFDNILVQERALRGDGDTPNSYTLKNPLENGNHGVIAIYSASQLASVGDLSGLKVGMANFSMSTKLNEVKLGDGAEDYENPNLNTLTIGNLTLLSNLDIRNCTGLTSVVDVSGCSNIESVYAEGSSITGVKTPNGGILKTLHLPETVTSLIIQNQPLLTDFSIPTFGNISTLRLEGVDYGLFNFVEILNAIQPNSRVRLLGIEMNIQTAEEILALYDKFDTFRGLDESGNTLDNAVIGGTIHCDTITSNDYAEMVRRYPNINIVYEHITSTVRFYVEGELVCTPIIVFDGADCPDPITEGIISTPTKAESDTSKFIFNSWDSDLKNITADTTVNAVFDEYKKYFVTFKDDRGSIVPINGNLTNIYYDRDGERVISVPDALESYSKVIDGATYDYHFEYWRNAETGEIGVVDVCGDDYSITYEAVFSEHRVNVVKFMNDDEVVSELHLYEGGHITVPANPTRISTAQYDFSFKGWSLDGSNVVDVPANVGNEDVTYYAVYDSILRYYTINFLDYDGKVLQSSLVAYGATPFCESPTREETAQYFYDFDGWSPKIEAVTGEATYMATYLQTLRTYTVKWVNEDGSSLLEEDVNVPYGTMPSYDGATPTKPGNAQYTYTFAGWHIDISTVTGNITYKATYTAEVNKYTVTWKNADGTVLETDVKVPYGDMPEYNGSTPTKASTAQYEYIFAGWDTAVSEVTGDVVYTATYTEHIRSYAIKFVDYNDTVLKSEVLEYGTMPSAPTPTRTGYDFIGWDKSVVAVTGEATYTAQYKIKTYTITWVFGSKTATTTCNYGSTPTPPSGFTVGSSYTADGFTYTCTGWGTINTVTGNATYTATVQGSGSITSRFTRLGSHSKDSGVDWATFESTGYYNHKDFKGLWCYVNVYGFDFRVLSTLDNVKINDIECTVDGLKTSSSATFDVRAIYGFDTSGNDVTKYEDITGAKYAFAGKLSSTRSTVTQSFTATETQMKLITWANSNLDKFIGGYNSNSFGLYLGEMDYVEIWGVYLTVHFTFG